MKSCRRPRHKVSLSFAPYYSQCKTVLLNQKLPFSFVPSGRLKNVCATMECIVENGKQVGLSPGTDTKSFCIGRGQYSLKYFWHQSTKRRKARSIAWRFRTEGKRSK